MVAVRAPQTLTLHVQETCSGRLAGRVHGHHAVDPGVLQVGLVDDQGAAVTMEQQLEVVGFLDWCVVMVPYNLGGRESWCTTLGNTGLRDTNLSNTSHSH